MITQLVRSRFKVSGIVGLLLVPASLLAQDFLKNNMFSHTYHVTEEELSCTQCHEGIEQTATLMDIKAVPASACIDCHEDDIKEDEVLKVQLKDESFKLPNKIGSEKLFFSHKGHLNRVKDVEASKQCGLCHGIAMGEVPVKNELPSMSNCMSCHEAEKAELSCTTCHPSAMKPVSHTLPTWERGSFHGREALFKKQECAACHKEENQCNECHMGMNGKKVHSFNYQFTHGMDVRFKTKDCATCHQPLEQFCSDCHTK